MIPVNSSAHDMLVQFNVETPMRDGVILRGDLYKPAGTEAWPVLLLRTVFRKRDFPRAFGQYDPAVFVRAGYAVLIQDVRGLGESDGEFDRFTADGQDGYDTVEWIANQPWCDGNVGMMGSYYAGFLQLMAAIQNPPHLKAICPMQTSVSVNRDCDNRGFLFASHIGWCLARQISRLRDGRYDEAVTRKYLPLFLDALQDYIHTQVATVPLSQMPVLQDTPFPLLRDYYHHLVDGFDDLKLIHKEGRDLDLRTVHIPAFYICGWYDSSRTPLLEHCLVQRSCGIPSQVLIAPWKPGEPPSRPDSALENGENTVDLQSEIIRWFNRHLKGIGTDVPAPIRYYDIVSDFQYASDSWIPNGSSLERLLLTPDGALQESEPSTSGFLTYYHDPANPLPYHSFGVLPSWPSDTKNAVLLSRPFSVECRIVGLVRTELFISADVPDADIMVSLLDVDPDGKTFVVCDGAVRARYRQDWNSRPLTPGQIYPVSVLLGHIVYTLPAGHNLGIAIYGSAFPKYDVNHGTGLRPAHDADLKSANIRIHCGPDTPSALILPVLLDTNIPFRRIQQ